MHRKIGDQLVKDVLHNSKTIFFSKLLNLCFWHKMILQPLKNQSDKIILENNFHFQWQIEISSHCFIFFSLATEKFGCYGCFQGVLIPQKVSDSLFISKSLPVVQNSVWAACGSLLLANAIGFAGWPRSYVIKWTFQ